MDRRESVIVGCALLLLTGMPEAAGQGEWARFRGPNAGDIQDDSALPDTWSETENVVWKTDIPGLSWSSPVVSGDHVFVTSAISAGEEPDPIPGLYDPGNESGAIPTTAEHRWMVYDIDFQTGEIRWARELHRAPPQIAKHLKNSYASETPVTDGRRVYVYFGSIGLVAALNMSGETVWRQEVGTFNTTVELGRRPRPLCMAIGCISLTTTRHARSSPRSIRRPARSCGGSAAPSAVRAGRRRSSGKTKSGPRS